MHKFICFAKCPELDVDNSKHCIATMASITDREERCGDYCPCGNQEKWKMIDDEKAI